MTSRSTSISVSQCICQVTPFERLLAQAKASGWDLEDLVRETGCGARCGLCRPYLSRMLRTGQTEFHELLTQDDY